MAKRPLPAYLDSPSHIYQSNPIHDRSSKFLAYFSPHLSPHDLQSNPDIATATHRIAAWRKSSTQRSLNDTHPIYETGHDDDGEKYGGKTLEKVLVSSNIVGAIVVARWYGGVMLGPVRFEHMRNCALDAIVKYKAESIRPAKQMKVHNDVARKESLVAVLKERDYSISVLRDLLAEKKGGAPASQDGGRGVGKESRYGMMPVAALERLEQVRDATIGWILKEIEKMEEVEAGKAKADEKSNGAEIKSASILDGKKPVSNVEKSNNVTIRPIPAPAEEDPSSNVPPPTMPTSEADIVNESDP
ncbi:MAG: hypothetical protein Q9170_007129 [Blastenia crenularia]